MSMHKKAFNLLAVMHFGNVMLYHVSLQIFICKYSSLTKQMSPGLNKSKSNRKVLQF